LVVTHLPTNDQSSDDFSSHRRSIRGDFSSCWLSIRWWLFPLLNH
jgi:hypothetical protein